jgi:predicted HicB family RNase H-like nuclease
MMKYKGYTGQVEYDDEAKIFHGTVIGIRGAITFEGESVAELEEAFRDSVEDYLEWCAELGQQPEKPSSGKFQLRLSPEIHHAVTVASSTKGESINTWITNWIKRGLREELGERV